ncbi:MAG: HigA family addiction module antidote protein [Allobaculum sp.]|nr:HigA family addiction module antidote protein [Allobaculum sp.]
MSKQAKLQSNIATHPGEILRNLLLVKEMSQKDLAVTIGKTTPVVNDILCGRRDINAEIAVLLEVVFEGYPASFWLECQAKYDIDKIRQSEKMKKMEQGIKDWRSLDNFINLRIIKKRSGIGDDMLEGLDFLRKLYKVDSITLLQDCLDRTENTAFFRKNDSLKTDKRNLNTWILLTRIANESQLLSNSFNVERKDELVNRLNDLFYTNTDTLSCLKEVLNEFGIKFIHEKKLDKVPVDGYSFWLGEHPTIVVTTRYSWIDNLAFTVFHELGHIIYHLYNDRDKDFLDIIEPGGDKKENDFEKEADNFAQLSLRRGCDFNKYFKRIENPFAVGLLIHKLSETHSINESIIIGQYQHYCKTILNHPAAYAIGAKLKQKIK